MNRDGGAYLLSHLFTYTENTIERKVNTPGNISTSSDQVSRAPEVD